MDNELHAALERHRELLQGQLAHFRAELTRELRAEMVARHRESSERTSVLRDNVSDGFRSVVQQMRTMKVQLDTIQRRTGYDTAALERQIKYGVAAIERAVQSIERDLGLARDSMTRELSLQRDQAYRMDRATQDRLIRLGDAMSTHSRS
jgi:hypothetical protein